MALAGLADPISSPRSIPAPWGFSRAGDTPPPPPPAPAPMPQPARDPLGGVGVPWGFGPGTPMVYPPGNSPAERVRADQEARGLDPHTAGAVVLTEQMRSAGLQPPTLPPTVRGMLDVSDQEIAAYRADVNARPEAYHEDAVHQLAMTDDRVAREAIARSRLNTPDQEFAPRGPSGGAGFARAFDQSIAPLVQPLGGRIAEHAAEVRRQLPAEGLGGWGGRQAGGAARMALALHPAGMAAVVGEQARATWDATGGDPYATVGSGVLSAVVNTLGLKVGDRMAAGLTEQLGRSYLAERGIGEGTRRILAEATAGAVDNVGRGELQLIGDQAVLAMRGHQSFGRALDNVLASQGHVIGDSIVSGGAGRLAFKGPELVHDAQAMGRGARDAAEIPVWQQAGRDISDQVRGSAPPGEASPQQPQPAADQQWHVQKQQHRPDDQTQPNVEDAGVVPPRGPGAGDAVGAEAVRARDGGGLAVQDPPSVTDEPVGAQRHAGGRQGTLELADGRSLPARYIMLEADDLVPSHDPRKGFSKRPDGDVNERPYEDPTEGKASRETVQRISTELKPGLVLADTPTPTDGPPVIDPERRVLGGNARSMGVQLAYSRGDARAKALREATIAAAERFGIDPAAAAGFRNPVIVRMVSAADAGERGSLSRALNQAMTTGRTADADAVSRGQKLTHEAASAVTRAIGDESIDGALSDPRASMDIVRQLRSAGVLSAQDVTAFVQGGALNAEGKLAVKRTLMGALIPDVRTLAETPPAIENQLIRTLGPSMRLLRATRGTDADFRGILDNALRAVATKRQSGARSMQDLVEQSSMFSEAWRGDPRGLALAELLDQGQPRKFSERLAALADAVEEAASGQIPLGAERPMTPAEAFDAAFGLNGKPAGSRGGLFGMPKRPSPEDAPNASAPRRPDESAQEYLLRRKSAWAEEATGFLFDRETLKAYERAGEEGTTPEDADMPEGQGGLFGMPGKEGPAAVEIPAGDPLLGGVQALDTNAARRSYLREAFKAPGMRRPVVNDSTGIQIGLGKHGIEKTLSGDRSPDHFEVVAGLRELLKAAAPGESAPDRRGRPHIESVQRFYARASVGDRLYDVIMTVRHTSRGARHYDLDEVRIEKPAGISVRSDEAGSSRVRPAAGLSDESIGQEPAPVKESGGAHEGRGVSGMPLAGKGAGTTHYHQANLTVPGDAKVRVRASEVITQMEKALGGLPIRAGHGLHKQRQAAGWYDPARDVIRNQSHNDLATAAHELGHAIHDRVLGWNQPPRGAARRELELAGRALYGSRQPNGGYAREGVAEYVSKRLHGEDVAKSMPATHKWFESTIASHKGFSREFAKVERMYNDWDLQGSRARVKSAVHETDNSVKGRLVQAWDQVRATTRGSNLATMFIDAGQPLRSAEAKLTRGRQLAPDKSPSMLYDANKGNAAGTARAFVQFGATDRAGNRVGPSLAEVLRPVYKRRSDFNEYAVAKRAELLEKRGINSGLRPEDIAESIRRLQSPEFEKALQGVTDWSGRLLDYVIESGGLSREQADLVRKLNPIYVPFQRHFAASEMGGKGGTGQGRSMASTGKGVKRIKGSGRELEDPLVSLTQQAERTIALANKMRVARAVADLAQSTPGSAWFAEKIPTPKEGHQFSIEQVAKQLEAAGADLSAADLSEVVTAFSNAQQYNGKENIVTIWRNGEREFWQLDPEVYKTLMSVNPDDLMPSIHIPHLSKAKRLVQLGATTVSTGFQARNLVKDWVSSMVATRRRGGAALDPTSSSRALWAMVKGDPDYSRWLATGGNLTTLMGQDRHAAKMVLDQVLTNSAKARFAKTAVHPIEALRVVGEHIEGATRLGEYRSALRVAEAKYGKGSEAAAVEAMMASKEVTVNFTRSGTVAEAINRMVPFFNARIQGTARFYKLFHERPLAATLRAFSYVTLPSLALWMVNKDEEWYQELPQWQRIGFWNFSLNGGKTVWKIPRPELIGLVFGALPEAVADDLYRKEKRETADAVWTIAKSHFPVDSLGSVPGLGTAVEHATNHSFFTGRSIVPDHERRSREPRHQYGTGQTETAKVIGDWLNVSPRLIEHDASGLTGGAALRMTRLAETMAGVRKEKASLADVPFIGGLVSPDPRGTRGRSVADFYEALGEYQQKGNKEFGTPENQRIYKVLDSGSDKMAKLRKAWEAGGITTEQYNRHALDTAKAHLKAAGLRKGD